MTILTELQYQPVHKECSGVIIPNVIKTDSISNQIILTHWEIKQFKHHEEDHQNHFGSYLLTDLMNINALNVLRT